jgi:Asp-tRNA(Asn)/Glu-tRNA(Gln) amidotransferase A subunit family amidase
MFQEYDRHDGLGLAELVRRREVTAEELLDEAIARVERLNPTLNAVVQRMYDEARAAVRAGIPDGPFTGVPYLLKDLGTHYRGTPTSSGSALFRGLVADHDSELVSRSKRAGLVIFGKTNTPEFGLTTSTEPRLWGPTRNPWSPGRSAGGSSGGAAAAVASGMVPMAHASDGGGSIRIPSSSCGLFGLKPTRGRTPFGPDHAEGWSGASVQHALTRTVRDSAALLDAVAGPDVGDPYWAPPPFRPYRDEVGAEPGRLRIAFTTRPWDPHGVDPECVAAVTGAAKLCEELGHVVTEDRPEWDEEARIAAARVIIFAHTRAELDEAERRLGRPATPDDVEPLVWAAAEYGAAATAPQMVAAMDTLHRVGRRLGQFFTRYDLLLTPTQCRVPPRLGVLDMCTEDRDTYVEALMASIAFTAPFNGAGNPAMSVPLHWAADGVPVGVQFAAPFGDEATLFRLASQLERARPWADRRPPPPQPA